MASEKIVALLPMKANSERVKGKNFRDFCGKPLFRWVLDTLLSVDGIDCVVINTDAREILAAAGLHESERIIIRDRRSELCGDLVSMNKIIADDIAAIDADIYVMTHTTNPFISAKTIEAAIAEYKGNVSAGRFDSLFTVDKVQTRFYRADASPINHDPSNLVRTQDLEPWYEENSNLYIFSRQSFAASGARIGIRPALMVTPPMESVDIDDEADWDFATIAARHLGLAQSQDGNA